MGLFDVLRGKTTQAPPQLDELFALPSAALTLESQLDLVSSTQGALCFKSGAGETEHTTDTQLSELLGEGASVDGAVLSRDDLGFTWLTVTDPDLSSLVTRIHGAASTLVDNNVGPRILCAVFGFVPKTPPGEGPVRIVYLHKAGTFYPFAPRGPHSRDNELELRVRNFLDGDLHIEKDLTKWMALWDAPVS